MSQNTHGILLQIISIGEGLFCDDSPNFFLSEMSSPGLTHAHGISDF